MMCHFGAKHIFINPLSTQSKTSISSNEIYTAGVIKNLSPWVSLLLSMVGGKPLDSCMCISLMRSLPPISYCILSADSSRSVCVYLRDVGKTFLKEAVVKIASACSCFKLNMFHVLIIALKWYQLIFDLSDQID